MTCYCVIKVLIDGFPEVMPRETWATAELVLFMNDLFDILNHFSKCPPVTSSFQCRLRKGSPHEEFWESVLRQLNNFKFVDCVSGRVIRLPCVDGWVTSINAVRHLWQFLQTKSFQFLNLRTLNQDGLENLFSAVRQFGGDNVNPTCALFCSASKTCVLNKISVPPDLR